MKKIILALMVLIVNITADGLSDKDIQLKKYEATNVVGIPAKMVEFGGYTKPLCKLAISDDGKYFFLKKVHSDCIKMTNSKGVKIICNRDKSVCKTRKELINFIQGTNSDKKHLSANKVSKYEDACKKGDVKACVMLGIMYYTGKDIKKDHDKALKIFKPMCEEKIGTCALFSQIILSTDIKGGVDDALYILNRACLAGDSKSCAKLAILYDDGEVVTKDTNKANDYFIKACDLGEGNACGIIANMYLKGEAVGKDITKAESMFKKACDLNASFACHRLGTLYSSDEYGLKNIPLALTFWEQACDLDNVKGCRVLGASHYLGEVTQKDIQKAIKFWSKACELKDGKLCNVVGDIYDDGKNISKDEQKAVDFWAMGCEYGNTENCSLVGKYYFEGSDIISIDKTKAAKYFKLGCEGNDYQACDVAGAIYASGEGVTKDHNIAVKLLSKACNGGNASGCQNLGVMYENGYGSLSKDLQKALELYEKGCDGGDINGCKKYKNLVDYNRKKEAQEKAKYRSGKYVCYTYYNGKNGWCGYITQNLGDSVRIENYKVRCGKGGFLGICTHINFSSCGGNNRLYVDGEYEARNNPRSIIVPKSCID